MVRYIGLDVHKKSIQVCILDARGDVLEEKKVPTDHHSILEFARTLGPDDQVALESCTFAWAVHDLLEPFAGRIVVSNAYKTRAIAEAKIKTDKVDARVLAELLRADYLPSVWVPDPQTRHMRHLVSQRHHLVRRMISLKNQIHAIFSRRLLTCPWSDMFGKNGRQWMKENRSLLPPHEQKELDCLLRILAAVEKERRAVEKDMAGLAFRENEVRLLMTIPGVDYPVAVALLAAIGDIRRFASPRKLCAYLGLVPSVHNSGNRQWHGRITKQGNSAARWMLVQAGHQLSRLSSPIRPFFERLRAKKGRQVAVVAVARKLATLAWHLLTDGQPYRYANARCIDKKFARLQIQATGRRRKPGPRPGHGTNKRKTDTVHLSGRSTFPRDLDQVHAEWELPPLKEPPPGEKRFVKSLGGKKPWLRIR
jgi:transposase